MWPQEWKQEFSKIYTLECKHQIMMDDTRRPTDDDGQPLTTIANHEHKKVS